MGSIKNSKIKKVKGDEYPLTQFELNYFKALVINRNASFNQGQASIQAFLTYLAGEKWGIEHPEDMDFTVDSDKESVTAVSKNA